MRKYGTDSSKVSMYVEYLITSVTDQAKRARLKPTDSLGDSVAMRIPQTTITLDATWTAVTTGLDFTMPVAACITSSTAAFWKIIKGHLTVS